MSIRFRVRGAQRLQPPQQASSALEEDWQHRISRPGVVWYHDFRNDAEVTNFKWPQAGGDVSRITTDGITGGALEIRTRLGAQADAGWWRMFSPLNGASNGRGVDDPGDGGNLPALAFTPGDNNLNFWNDGYYCHATKQNVAGFGYDGDEFFIQFRMKIQGTRNATNNPDEGKMAFIGITRNTPAQEIVCTDRTHRCWFMYTNFGGDTTKFLMAPQGDAQVIPNQKMQPNGLYRDTVYGVAGGLQADVNALAYPYDEWFTVLIRVVPGTTNGIASTNPTADHRISVWLAKDDEYEYTLVHDWWQTQFDFSEGFPMGWNAFQPSSYMNGVTSDGAAWYRRVGQVIFSKKWIPCPLPTTARAPAWFADLADNCWATPVTNLLFDVAPTPLIGDQGDVVDAWTGAYMDNRYGEYGLLAQGGHNGYPGNEGYALALRTDSPAWVRLTAPSNTGGGVEGTNTAANYGDGRPRAVHGWGRGACDLTSRVWFAGMDGMESAAGWWSTATYSFDRFSIDGQSFPVPLDGGMGPWEYLGLGIDPLPDNSPSVFNWQSGPGAYDPVENTVYSSPQYSVATPPTGLFTVYCGDGTLTPWPDVGYLPGNPFSSAWSAVVPEKRVIVYGSVTEAQIYVLDLTDVASGFVAKATTGTPGDAFTTQAGAAYHRKSGKILVWHHNMGASLKALSVPDDPINGTYSWSDVSPSGNNAVTPPGTLHGDFEGVYKKFQIIDEMGDGRSAAVVITANDTNNTFVYALPNDL